MSGASCAGTPGIAACWTKSSALARSRADPRNSRSIGAKPAPAASSGLCARKPRNRRRAARSTERDWDADMAAPLPDSLRAVLREDRIRGHDGELLFQGLRRLRERGAVAHCPIRVPGDSPMESLRL